ncbi:hypothetical protein PCCS19_48890 [Paenibacillus sp. CCS19]|uniref:hypothetical protein n=1 Tax=Paenibacillus sp. CCS19 TaxID=3158387 RepID=UPI0025655898|nr:hypothetical protein [Paenibacillus cellulosilyticus]GMK41830.1 hypothetical protein PCCS19_48890 [Paenibacillus cellulosilyticus]
MFRASDELLRSSGSVSVSADVWAANSVITVRYSIASFSRHCAFNKGSPCIAAGDAWAAY